MKVGICAIIKDCNESYLKEWIEWHQLIGVDYFFIYDNESQHPIKNIFNDKHIIVTDFSGSVQQLPASQDCIKQQKKKTQPVCDWIAFIDDDEFIVPECSNIKTVLNEYKKYSGLGINWLTFGSSGLKYKTEEKQILKFTKILDNENPLNTHIKSIVKPTHVEEFTSPHSMRFENFKLNKYLNRYFKGFRKYIRPKGICVDIENNMIPYAFTKKPIHYKMWIAHYYLKSEEEFKFKISRGRADTDNIEYKLKIDSFYSLDKLCTKENNFVKNLYLKLITK
jgi:hypothetical protein